MKSGIEQLREWMTRRVFTQRDTARHFGWDETFLSHLLAGRRGPGLATAVKIERETGIPVEAWMPTSEDKSVSAASPMRRKRTA